MKLVFIGLSLSSSWGNGHATTYRGLLRGLKGLGHELLFLEDDKPWYAGNRDLPEPEFCRLELYDGPDDLQRFGPDLQDADAVIIGSYVPDGIAVIDWVVRQQPRRLCFYDIDTPVTLAALGQNACTYLAPRQVAMFDAYLSFSGGRSLMELTGTFGARQALAFYCAVDETRYRPTGTARRWDLGYLGTYSPDRQPVLDRLLLEPARRLPELAFVVAGPQYPDDIAWPANVERIEHLPPARHADFYSAQRFTLNVTRADMVAAGHSPSVRLFEAAACGVPILSDRWAGLDELLPDRAAALIVDDSDAVVTALTATDDSSRRQLADTARAIVLANHTGAARAAQLINILSHIADRQRGGTVSTTGATVRPEERLLP